MGREYAKHKGFTLIELMVTIAIMAVIAAIAAPSFQNLIQKNQLKTEVSEFLDAINDAKYRAKTQGKTTILQIDSSSEDEDTIVWEPKSSSKVLFDDHGDDVITFLNNGQLVTEANNFPICISFTHKKSGDVMAVSLSKIGIITMRKNC